MTAVVDLTELAKRVESLAGPDREVDAEVVVALDLRPDWCRDYGTEIYIDPHGPNASGEFAVLINTTGGKRSRGHPSIGSYVHYTASLDAAMSLVPENFSCELTQSAAPASAPELRFTRCRLWDWRRGPLAVDPANEWKAEGNRPLPLNVVAAALRARARMQEGRR